MRYQDIECRLRGGRGLKKALLSDWPNENPVVHSQRWLLYYYQDVWRKIATEVESNVPAERGARGVELRGTCLRLDRTTKGRRKSAKRSCSDIIQT